MDTKHLRTFVTVVDLGSFTRAARGLGLSQSAISQQLGALEKQLGVTLLARSGSGARPTPAGDTLVQYARQILRKMEEAQQVLVDYEGTDRGVLRIGASGAACHHLLPALLREFHDRHPKVALQMLSGSMPVTVQRLLDDDLDVGFFTLPVTENRLRIVEMGYDELVAIAAPSHPWAGRKRVHPSEFADQPLLVSERCGRTFRLIERLFLEAGVMPRIAMEMDHLEAVAGMARVGLGIGIVPRWAVTAEVAAGQLAAFGIGKNGLRRRWGLAAVNERHRPHSARAFARLCADSFPQVLAAEAVATGSVV